MKAKDRKRVQEALESVPSNNKRVTRLRDEFNRKGFLSRKELKILDRLATSQLQQGLNG